MKSRLPAESIELVMSASTYREFIEKWMEYGLPNRRLSYADIARVGGFKARSFPRDVVKGAKRITLNSLPKFVQGLRLNSGFASLFRILVELEHVDCRSVAKNSADLERLRGRQIKRIRERKQIVATSDKVFSIGSIPEIYAALNTPTEGTTAKEISTKISLEKNLVIEALEKMEEAKIVRRERSRYFANETHLNIEGLSQSEIFRKHFIDASNRATKMAESNLASDRKLFLSSAFSVREVDLPLLKNQLRDVLLKFVDTAEAANGSKVVNLVASLF